MSTQNLSNLVTNLDSTLQTFLSKRDQNNQSLTDNLSIKKLDEDFERIKQDFQKELIELKKQFISQHYIVYKKIENMKSEKSKLSEDLNEIETRIKTILEVLKK